MRDRGHFIRDVQVSPIAVTDGMENFESEMISEIGSPDSCFFKFISNDILSLEELKDENPISGGKPLYQH